MRLPSKAPTCKEPLNSNNILYNITFSSEKKIKKCGLWTDMKANPKKKLGGGGISHTDVTLFPSPNLLFVEEKIAKGRKL